jgi:hypothetical protein
VSVDVEIYYFLVVAMFSAGCFGEAEMLAGIESLAKVVAVRYARQKNRQR